MFRLALVLCLAALVASRTAAAADVEVELVLLADTTGSIDENEVRFQRQGYAAAITDPGVIAAIQGSIYGTIALTYVEWGAADSQAVVVPWRVIDGPESAQAFARELLLPPRMAFGRNAIGAALLKGKQLIESNGIEGLRRVIDISGDSANSFGGPSIASARAQVLAAGITINGLAILCRNCSGPTGPGLEHRYRREIIGGTGAFVVTAESAGAFADAIRRKLILEISGELPPLHVAAD